MYSIENGIIKVDGRNKNGGQDFLEIETTDSKRLIITASVSGKLIVSLKLK